MTATIQPLHPVDDPRPPEFADDALALAFAERYADDLRYVALWNLWLTWTGTYWAQDETLAVFDRARRINREIAERALRPGGTKAKRVATAIASAKAVAATLSLARSDRRIAATTEQWDRDPFALCTPAGIVDLRSGVLRPALPEDYATRSTSVAPAPPGATSPLWMTFLARVMDGNTELVGYLQRVAGYALTGETKEHALWFAHGTGRNGKGVFLNTLSRICGTYAAVSAMETFVSSGSSQHPTDLAMLRGARLVTSQETEDGRRWAESKIKAMTGGDPITARYMRQDFFTFDPQFKLIIAGNHKPGLRGVDEAIRARFNLVPFSVTIPQAERDTDLPEKLKAEWPAILRWAIDGCLDWQRTGLRPPDAVQAATADYLAEEDAFSLWLTECTERRDWSRENTADLFASWRRWAEAAGEFVGSQKRFSQSLQARGFTPKRQSGTGKMGFEAIGLRRPAYDQN